MVCAEGYPAEVVCDLLGVSRATYYRFLSGESSDRQVADERLRPLIGRIFWDNSRRYGARRVMEALKARGVSCGARRVSRLMRMMDLRAIQPKSFRPKTTDSRHCLGYSPNLLLKDDLAQGLNRLWVGDITYLQLETQRFAYASLLMDRFSRRIIGWNVQSHMTDELTYGTLNQALRLRRPNGSMIHHTDRGGQYASRRYRSLLARFGIAQSMSRAGNPYDNAFMESCFGTIKTEMASDRYRNVEHARKEITDFIRYYNTRRLHSSLDYRTPLAFEEEHQEKQKKSFPRS